jgi:hypothetical protein
VGDVRERWESALLRVRRGVGDAEHGWFAVQGWTLPVKQEDTEILDLVILRAEALQQKVNATLGSRLPLQVGLGHFGCTVGVLARRWHDRPLQCKCKCGVGAPL